MFNKKIYFICIGLLSLMTMGTFYVQTVEAAIGPITPPQVTENPGVTTTLNYFDKSNYFRHLVDNQIRNYDGYCTFVTMGMLLSYYDTFLNGNIIPEHYENNSSITCQADLNADTFESPGIKPNMFLYSELGYTSFESYVRGEKDNCYFAYMAYHNGITNGFSTGTETSLYQAMLNSMFQDTEFNFTVHVETIFDTNKYQNQTQIRNDMVTLLNQGKILILEYTFCRMDGHSVIVYKFENNTFITHSGGYDTATYFPIDFNDPYLEFVNFAYFDVDSPNNAYSDNYLVNGVGYCGDGHHYHNYTYSSYNANKHVRRCSCGLVEFAAHQTEGPANERFQRCIFCNALVDTHNVAVNSLNLPVLTLGIRN